MKRTKKILAFVAVLAVLATCAVNSIAAVTSADPRPTTAFIDFSKEAPVGGAISPAEEGRTIVEYDADQQAHKITLGQAIRSYRVNVTFNDKHVVYSKDGKVVNGTFAFMVKVNNPSNQYAVVSGSKMNFANAKANSAYVGDVNYRKTTDWQIVTIDVSELLNSNDSWTAANAADPIKWTSVYLSLYKSQSNGGTSGAYAATDIFWLKWAGIFASPEDAYAYFGETTPIDAAVIDFTKNSALSTDAYSVNPENNTALAYDETEAALKVTPKETNRDAYQLRTYLTREKSMRVSAKEYPIFAVLVKNTVSSATNANTQSVGGYIGAKNANPTAGSLVAYFNKVQNIYGKGYQLLIYDASERAAATNDDEWNSYYLNLTLSPETYSTSNNPIYIKWMGTFKSMKDVYLYTGDALAATTGKTFKKYDTEEGYNSAGLPNNPYVLDGFTYDADEQALAIYGKTASLYTYTASGSYRDMISAKPIMAAYVKVPSSVKKYAFHADSGAALGTYFASGNKDYAATEDYQLIYWDTRESEINTAGEYRQIRLITDAEGGNTTETNPAYVKWLGAFASVAEAEQYVVKYEMDIVKAFENKVDALPEAITPANGAAIKAARAAYGALTTSQKLMTSYNPMLRADEEVYATYEPNLVGANLRITGDGVRFGSKFVAPATYNGYELAASGYLFCREDMWDAYGNNQPLTMDDATGDGTNFATYVENTNLPTSGQLLSYYVSVTDIPEDSRDVQLIGRGYLKYTRGEEVVYIYTDESSNAAANGAHASMGWVRSLNKVIELDQAAQK